MLKPCLNVGHIGAALPSSVIQMNNLFDVTEHLSDFFTSTDCLYSSQRILKDELIPGGVGSFVLTRSGEIVYYYDEKPVALITRLASEKGCDANVGKWYRKQWYFENFLKKQNPECNHITFIHASSSTNMLQEFISGVSMVMTQEFNGEGFNRPNFGGNSIYYYDTDKNVDTWVDISATILSIVSLTVMKTKQSQVMVDQFAE